MIIATLSHASVPSKVAFEGWSIKCEPQADNTDNNCVAKQTVTIGGDVNKMIIGVMVAYMKEHPLPHIIFRVSPGANRDKGAAVKVDELDHFQVPITNCDENICEVRSFIPEQLLAQMRSGQLLQFAFFLEDEQVTYPISLEGFDETYQSLLTRIK